MAALDDAARAAKALLAPDEAQLVRKMISNQIPIPTIMKRLDLVRRARRIDKTSGLSDAERSAFMDIVNSLNTMGALGRIAAKRHGNSHLVGFRYGTEGSVMEHTPESALANAVHTMSLGGDEVVEKIIKKMRKTSADKRGLAAAEVQEFKESSPVFKDSTRKRISKKRLSAADYDADALMFEALRKLIGPVGPGSL